MTVEEYLEVYERYPFQSENEEVYEDKEKIRKYNKELIEKYPWLLPRNRWTDLPVGEKPANYEETFEESVKAKFVSDVESAARMKASGWNRELVDGLSTAEEALKFLDDHPEKFEELKAKKRKRDDEYYSYDYEYTELDSLPRGWRIAFGDKICEEIQEDLESFNFVDKYRIVQIKEKFGRLRWYDNGTPIEYGEVEEFTIPLDDKVWEYSNDDYWTYVDHRDDNYQYCVKKKIVRKSRIPDIIRKYEDLSGEICIECGKPAKWVSKGWISYYCDDCKNKFGDGRNYELISEEDE